MAENDFEQKMSAFFKNPLIKVIILGFLVFMLMIPVALIDGVISERRYSRDEVVQEVTASWGFSQSLIGPWIVVPYDYHWSETDKDGKAIARKMTRYAWFLPETLDVKGQQNTEIRYRGIYKVPLYRARLDFSGKFPKPDLSAWVSDPLDIQWGNSHLVFRISDVRAVASRAHLKWNSLNLEFQPGSGDSAGLFPGIHVPLNETVFNDSNDFSFSLDLQGSDGLFFAPFGRDTRVVLSGNWPDPSFQGQWLPKDRKITAEGFQAEWQIPFLGRNYPEKWVTGQGVEEKIDATAFGLRLHVAIDEYRMAHRSVKYAILFLVLLFAVLWLFEINAKIGVHPMHYFFVGVAICLFYLLELSLAEHIGFDSAYALASAMIILLVSGYCASRIKAYLDNCRIHFIQELFC
jgi:inner membrane protein